MIESAKEARLDKKLELEQQLEEKRVERQSEADAVQAANDAATPSTEYVQQPAYIFDLSQEYLEYAQAGAATETDRTAIATPAAKPTTAADFHGLKSVVYSPSIPTDFSYVKITAISLSDNVGASLDLLI